ncbi:MAG: metal-dependent hydrolase [Vicinamibacterales bacterium]
MPSPLGHLLAGLAVGWSLDSTPRRARTPARAERPALGWPGLTPLALGCAAAAALPDADLLLPIAHRTVTHSLTATFVLLIIVAGVTRWVTGRARWRIAAAIAAAHATHILMDWLGADPFPPAGLQMFWPFDSRFVIAPVELFPGVERNFSKPEVITSNVYAAVIELALMGPVAWMAWRLRDRRSRSDASGVHVEAAP